MTEWYRAATSEVDAYCVEHMGDRDQCNGQHREVAEHIATFGR